MKLDNLLSKVQKQKAILQKLTETDLSEIVFFHFAQNVTIDGITDILVSRTGYTGEDGFELYLAADKVAALWDKLLEAGKEDGLKPCGLGARDTLRLEARLTVIWSRAYKRYLST